MTGFVEDRFPLGVAFGASGGPQWRTDVVTLASGAEARNARWAGSRRRYDAGSGIRSLSDLQAVALFFERMRGRLTGFRFRDPFDHLSSAAPGAGGDPNALDGPLGVGDGATDVFALVKTYGSGAQAYVRRIAKPVAGSVRIARDGVELADGSDFACDSSTGLVTFLGGAPALGAVLTAGFRFDVPVRFDIDRLDMSLTHVRAGRVPTIPLVEIDPLTEA